MLRFALVLVASLTSFAAAHAQSPADRWPDRPIRLIVPFPAGATTDLVARIVAAKLGERLGQPIVIENRAGASGSVGAEAVVRATSTHAIASSLNPNLAYDPVKDFAPVAMVGEAPYVLVVTNALPATTIPELVALAKAKPRALNYSTVGPASLAQFAGALFSKMTGVELTAVPYRSATQAMVDVNEGRVEMQFGAIGASLPFVRDGKVRPLAVTSSKRVDALPAVPTLSESGLPGYEAVLWIAFLMPPATSSAIIARMNQETVAALAEPDVRQGLAAQAVQVTSSTPDELRERIRRDIEKWRTIAAEAGIKPE
jgi:tripartite-type tricarboxylate transporter receptor subunit TctC